ncbi:MAG: hypothetical protein EHM14_09335 [Methanothrix sp.]|nr:MAG: hypothetical protein EHM14_09335 [Methanothrix sp.]
MRYGFLSKDDTISGCILPDKMHFASSFSDEVAVSLGKVTNNVSYGNDCDIVIQIPKDLLT